MKIKKEDIKKLNQDLKEKSPEDIVRWALSMSKAPVITTNFRPYESAILHLVTSHKKDINVIWCDTGYNTSKTYLHANELTKTLNLNIQLYVPKQTVAYRNLTLGLPNVNEPNHQVFSEQVKLEPFKRAMNEHSPDIWFTNIRKGQTEFRNSIDIVSLSQDGILKVSPFYYFTDQDLDQYIEIHNLPNEFNYFDPTKVENNRECGIHI